MDFNKVLFIAVLGVIVIVALDSYSKYAEKKRRDDLKAQELANETLIQLQEIQQQQMQDDRGFLGGLFSGIPLIGGLF